MSTVLRCVSLPARLDRFSAGRRRRRRRRDLGYRRAGVVARKMAKRGYKLRILLNFSSSSSFFFLFFFLFLFAVFVCMRNENVHVGEVNERWRNAS